MVFNIARILSKICVKFFFFLKIKGKENIPLKGKIIICCNHQKIIDPAFIVSCTKRHIAFLSKQELYNNRLIRFFMNKCGTIPVNRDGHDLQSMKQSLAVLSNGGVLGIFPQGTRSKDGEKEFKPGVSMLAIRTQTPLIPIHIIGNYKLFRRMSVVIGKPITLEKYSGQKLTTEEYSRIANEEIAHSLLSLGKNNGEDQVRSAV